MDSMFEPLAPEEMAAVESAPRPAIKTPIVPVPADAPAMNFKHPEHGEPTFAWAWRGEDGLHGYSCRWDYIGEDDLPAKHMLPVTYCDLGNGKRGWRSKGIPSPRPLLYLASILADPATWILICEGKRRATPRATSFQTWQPRRRCTVPSRPTSLISRPAPAASW